MRLLNLGIVGWNHEVNTYISLIRDGLIKNVEVIAIYEQKLAIQKTIHHYYPNIPVYQDYKEMIDNEKVEAVLSFHSSYNYSK